MKKSLILLMVCAVSMAANAQKSAKINQSLADSLTSWAVTDQTAAMPQPQTGPHSYLSRSQWRHYQDSVFTANKKLVEGVFNKYGFPGIGLVGRTGSKHFWLVVQHCDKFPEFQARVLTAMKKQVDKNNAIAADYAYLTDRVLINTGQKQLYATQVTYNTKICQAYPKPLADSANVDKRRKEVGLEPVRMYLNEMSEAHFQMNQESYKKQGINNPALYNLTK